MGIWIDGGLKWAGHIERVRRKVGQLLGVLGRAGAVLDGGLLRSLYNGLVLPHIQYGLMVWGDFEGDGNGVRAGPLLGYQKRFVGLMAGRRGRYHADPLFASYGVLKVGDLYRQQLRVHGWKFWRGLLPEAQGALLARVGQVHGHATRAARMGLAVTTGDHGRVGYRVPGEWNSLTDEQRGAVSLAAFKRGSKGGFLATYGAFRCGGCYVCL